MVTVLPLYGGGSAEHGENGPFPKDAPLRVSMTPICILVAQRLNNELALLIG